MARHQNAIDPYVTMLKRSEWNAMVLGGFAFFLVMLALFVAKQDGQSSAVLGSVVGEIQQKIGLGLLCASALAGTASLWFAGRYVYFTKWPERFEE